jgi:uncharacterized protein (DUF2126 family)
MNVTSNWQWRDFLYRHDVPQVVLESEFDWLDADEQSGFFRYRGSWYHISMFLRTSIAPWHGIHNDSAFSGVAIEVSRDGEQYRIGTLIS